MAKPWEFSRRNDCAPAGRGLSAAFASHGFAVGQNPNAPPGRSLCRLRDMSAAVSLNRMAIGLMQAAPY